MRIVRVLVLALLFSLLIVGVHALAYGSIFTETKMDYISNSMFLVGTVIFFPSVALRLGTGNLFLGIRYTVYRVRNSGKKLVYETLDEYVEDKKYTPKGDIINEVMILSFIIIGISYYLAFTWSP